MALPKAVGDLLLNNDWINSEALPYQVIYSSAMAIALP